MRDSAWPTRAIDPCGDTITIADYHAASFVKLADGVGSDLAAYPNGATDDPQAAPQRVPLPRL